MVVGNNDGTNVMADNDVIDAHMGNVYIFVEIINQVDLGDGSNVDCH